MQNIKLQDNHKYLLILAGSPRGGEITWKSIEKYVRSYLNADLAICTGKKFIKDQSFLHNLVYDWTFDEPSNWENYYNLNFPLIWEKPFSLGKGTGLYESGLIHFAIKDIIYRNYLDIINKYDFVIYTRFDQLHIDYHPRGIKNKILIPNGEDYFGICDRHVLLDSQYSNNYFNILNYFFKQYKDLSKFEYLNCETVYKNQIDTFVDSENIFRFKRNFFTVATKSDSTNWRIAIYKLILVKDIYLKYPDEFMICMKNYIIFLRKYKLNKLNLIFITNYFYLEVRQKLGKIKKLFVKQIV